MSAALSALASGPVVLEDLPLRVDPDEVLRFQGYKKGVDVPSAEVRGIFAEALEMGERLMRPRAVYCAAPVARQGPDSIAARGLTLTIPDIGRLWGPLEAVGAGICTVGDAIEERVRTLFDAREFPLAVMLDSVGSAAVESLAEYVNDLLCQAGLGRGRQGHQPRQPRLCGLGHRRAAPALRPVWGRAHRRHAERGLLHAAREDHHFLVGVGSAARVDHYFTQCRRCWMRDCAYRRAPATVTVRRSGPSPRPRWRGAPGKG